MASAATVTRLIPLRHNPTPSLNPNALLRQHGGGFRSTTWRQRGAAAISLALRNRRPVLSLRSSGSDAAELSDFEDERAGSSAVSPAGESLIMEPLPQDNYIALFVGMLALDKDPLDREHAVNTLWKYSRREKTCIDRIIQYPGCINLVISLLRSDSCSACEAAAGLLREISSIDLYRVLVSESGAIEEIAALLRRPSLTAEVKEQSICALWNLTIEEGSREKVVKSDILPALIKFLDDDAINIKEAICGVLSNLALSHCYHSIMVESAVIPKLAVLLRCKDKEYRTVRQEAKNTMLEFCKDEYKKILVVEEGLIPVPIIGSESYKYYKSDASHSFPFLPDGTTIPRITTPSRYSSFESVPDVDIPDKSMLTPSQVKALVAHSQQKFLVSTGLIEAEEQAKSQMEASLIECQTLLLLEDGVARLVLILYLEDSSAISRAACAIADASISEQLRISFKEAGAIRPLVERLCHKEMAVRESAAHALERLSISHEVCHFIESQNLCGPLFGIIKSTGTPASINEKIINILARICNPEKLMKSELRDNTRGTEKPSNLVNASESDNSGKVGNPISASQISGWDMSDLDVICSLVDLLKTSSSNTQRKVYHVLEYLTNFDVHQSAFVNSGIDTAIFASLCEISSLEGEDYYGKLSDTEVEEAGLVVEAACRLLTKLLDFDEFYDKIDINPLLDLLRKILKSSGIPLTVKDWVASCLVKMQLLVGPFVVMDNSIDKEVTLYKVIPRLIEQMKMSPSLEYREAALINLKDVISKGMIEFSRAVASSGGIFPLVELIDQVNGPALDAGLVILHNLCMDNENLNAVVSAGAIPILRRIILSQKPQWTLALNVLRKLPT